MLLFLPADAPSMTGTEHDVGNPDCHSPFAGPLVGVMGAIPFVEGLVGCSVLIGERIGFIDIARCGVRIGSNGADVRDPAGLSSRG